MRRPVHITPFCTVEELELLSRAAPSLVERNQWEIVCRLARGQSTREVAAATGYSAHWIRVVVGRYNRDGTAGIGDRRHDNPGEPLLSEAALAELAVALRGPAPDGGAKWTGPQVTAWIAARTGRPAGPDVGYDYLRRLGIRPRRAWRKDR